MKAATRTKVRGPLQPPELAAAAIFGALTAVLSVVAGLIPVGVAQVLVALPVAFLAVTGRVRTVIAATTAAAVVALIAGGPFAVAAVVLLAAIGTLVGFAQRRWGRSAVFVIFACSVPMGVAVAAAVVGLLVVFEQTRVLLLEALVNTMRGMLTAFEAAGSDPELSRVVNETIDFLVTYWWLWIGSAVVLGVVGTALLSFGIFASVAQRSTWPRQQVGWPARITECEPGPLPVKLHSVSYRYPNATSDALSEVDLTITEGEFVAVVGANGSGKSTLARILAGLDPTSGFVDRPGPVGLGSPDGTVLVFQHPEAQVLGRTVGEDLRWGTTGDIDIDILLDRVGLEGMADRATEDLSGGQQQRLALAAALVRTPKLLIADEITAMVDADSRTALIAVLADIAASGTTVVLITHLDDEAARADRVVHLERGRIVDPPAREQRRDAVTAAPPSKWLPVLELRDVTHTYADRTPWAHTALRNVTLTVGRGEGIVVVGANGSGKTTLAWTIAGLLRPTSGTCTVHDTPTADVRGEVGLVFQQARLQLQRPTVAREVSEVAGLPRTDHQYVAAVLKRVGLGVDLAVRPIDQLSGGEMRRVAIAAQLSRAPRVLVLDEPLAGLDTAGRRELISILVYLRTVEHVTIIVISHDLHGMEEVCSRTVVLEDGTVVDDGTKAVA
ncbi:ABC transporter ATP-binding protein [Rhodococcus sp. NPDC060086]|uniref:ABC transporter ATP-binding protein n=1 Tax=Rhodococcus sp. NPDC060086 TaxID=3347055 RepID=UPI003664580C